MDLRRLRSFVAVAEELSFSRAAQRLHISQQGLSAQIRHLEAEIGVSVLTRTTRRVELTPAGRALLDKARVAIAAIDDAIASARWAAAGTDGPLKLFYVFQLPSAAEQLVGDLRARHPDLGVFTSMLYEGDGVRGLRDGTLDAGFTWWPGVFDGLGSRVVDRVEVLGVIAADHPLASCERLPVGDLARDPVVLFQRDYHERAYDACRRHLEMHASDPLQLHDADFSLDFSPRKMLEEVAGPRCSTLALGEAYAAAGVEGLVAAPLDPPLFAEALLLWREPATPAVRALID